MVVSGHISHFEMEPQSTVELIKTPELIRAPTLADVKKSLDVPHGVVGWEISPMARFIMDAAFWCFVAVYLATALDYNFERAFPLTVIALMGFCFWLNKVLPTNITEIPGRVGVQFSEMTEANPSAVSYLQLAVVVICFALWIIIDVIDDAQRLIPLGGLMCFVGGTYATSVHRTQIRWRPVIGGLSLQLALGFLILRTDPGFELFRYLGEAVEHFLEHVLAGVIFVFGETYYTSFFAFKVLPVIIFFSSIVSIAFYMGWLQSMFVSIAGVVQGALHTSTTESFVAAANIFIGQTEAPLLIKPFLKDQTISELHTVMVCGFATVAGGVLAAYISFGVSGTHLISASVMSCPAALAVAKLSWPETEEPRITLESAADKANEEQGDYNVIDAAANGATNAVSLVANIGANLIAFLSIWSFVDWGLAGLGGLIGYDDFGASLICSYVFWPVALLMGVPPTDCYAVGALLGKKILVNEFAAYEELGQLVKEGGAGLLPRSEIIATYALCGFSNLGSIGCQLGALGALAPTRRKDLASAVFRAMICGNVACFLTACVAGMLYKEG